MTPHLPWWRILLIALLRRSHMVVTAWLVRLESSSPKNIRSVLDEDAPPAHWLAHVRTLAPKAAFVTRAAPGVETPSADEEVPPPPAQWTAYVQAARARAQARTTPPRRRWWGDFIAYGAGLLWRQLTFAGKRSLTRETPGRAYKGWLFRTPSAHDPVVTNQPSPLSSINICGPSALDPGLAVAPIRPWSSASDTALTGTKITHSDPEPHDPSPRFRQWLQRLASPLTTLLAIRETAALPKNPCSVPALPAIVDATVLTETVTVSDRVATPAAARSEAQPPCTEAGFISQVKTTVLVAGPPAALTRCGGVVLAHETAITVPMAPPSTAVVQKTVLLFPSKKPRTPVLPISSLNTKGGLDTRVIVPITGRPPPLSAPAHDGAPRSLSEIGGYPAPWKDGRLERDATQNIEITDRTTLASASASASASTAAGPLGASALRWTLAQCLRILWTMGRTKAWLGERLRRAPTLSPELPSAQPANEAQSMPAVSDVPGNVQCSVPVAVLESTIAVPLDCAAQSVSVPSITEALALHTVPAAAAIVLPNPVVPRSPREAVANPSPWIVNSPRQKYPVKKIADAHPADRVAPPCTSPAHHASTAGIPPLPLLTVAGPVAQIFRPSHREQTLPQLVKTTTRSLSMGWGHRLLDRLWQVLFSPRRRITNSSQAPSPSPFVATVDTMISQRRHTTIAAAPMANPEALQGPKSTDAASLGPLVLPLRVASHAWPSLADTKDHRPGNAWGEQPGSMFTAAASPRPLALPLQLPLRVENHPWPSLAEEMVDDLEPIGVRSMAEVIDATEWGGWSWNG